MKPGQYGLALHTTTPELGLALMSSDGTVKAQVWDLGRGLSSHLHTYLRDFLQPQAWTDLAWVAVARGPGGFTGTRIGMVTARTLGQQLDIPVVGISTLAAIAQQAQHPETINAAVSNSPISHETAGPDLAVQMPARRGAFFTGIYRRGSSLTAVLEDSVMIPEDWQRTLADWPHPYCLILAPDALGETVRAVLDLAHQNWQAGQAGDWADALPFYGQHPVE